MCFAVMNHVQDNQRKSARKLVQTTFKIFQKINNSKTENFIIKYDLGFNKVNLRIVLLHLIKLYMLEDLAMRQIFPGMLLHGSWRRDL